MSVHGRQTPPTGHGELLAEPPYEQWAGLARATAAMTDGWPEPFRSLRSLARDEAIALAREYTAEIGIVARPTAPIDLIVMTGHQPELYHPGVWVKDFLLQRLSDELPALGIDIVVDTDVAGTIELVTPQLDPDVSVARVALAQAHAGAYVDAPVPDPDTRMSFRAAGTAALSTLPAPAIGRHFARFCDLLDVTAQTSGDLPTALTAARRRYETPAGTDYLELPVSRQCGGQAYLRFAAHVLGNAERFRAVANDALHAYRQRTQTRSVAQPFPDLGGDADAVEVPFWLVDGGRRLPLYVQQDQLTDGAEVIAQVSADPIQTARALAAAEWILAPRAMTLTLFERLFVADLFIHGTGGGRYDRVTDAVARAFLGLEPPPFVVASMTMLLPLGCPITGPREVAVLEERLHRLEHNPDQVLDEVEFDTVEEQQQADALARRKAELVVAIASPGADRKTLALEIRETNRQLAAVLAAVVEETRRGLARARSAYAASAILTDRTYPYCLWDPCEVMDKVR